MPMYGFACKNKKCLHQWEELTSYDETGKYKGIKCPECKSSKKEKLLSSCHAVFSDPRSSSKWDNFSYRAGKTMDEAQECRRNAQGKSHVGPNSYENYEAQVTADINNDANWGKVK